MVNFKGLVDFRCHFFTSDSKPVQPELEHQLALWLAELDSHALGHLVTYASRPGEAPLVSAAAEASGGKMLPFALINPTTCDSKERAEELVGRYGFRGFLLFPAAHGFRIGSPEVQGVFEVATTIGAPVVIHCGLLAAEHRDQLKRPRALDLSLGNPLEVIPAATRFPEVSFVIPQFGSGFFREALMAGEMCENVFLDTSTENRWIRTQPSVLRLEDVFERALGVFGADRILFGTGSTPTPRAWRHDLFTVQREALGALEISAADQSLIFRDNAHRLLGLS
jgi:uncharacterized protein